MTNKNKLKGWGNRLNANLSASLAVLTKTCPAWVSFQETLQTRIVFLVPIISKCQSWWMKNLHWFNEFEDVWVILVTWKCNWHPLSTTDALFMCWKSNKHISPVTDYFFHLYFPSYHFISTTIRCSIPSPLSMKIQFLVDFVLSFNLKKAHFD